MSTSPSPGGVYASVRVQRAADRLQQHIASSKLRPGDQYMTASEASALLGESETTAQRAMAVLARRGWLERRRRAGTFIGKAAATHTSTHCIHFVMPETLEEDSRLQTDTWGQIEGLRRVIPQSTVQLHFVSHQDMAHTRQIVEQATDTETAGGFVVRRSSRAMRCFFNQLALPAVIWGSVEPDLKNLCWLGLDQAQTGRLLADHLIRGGCRRLATIMRDAWARGDYLLHDGVAEALTQACLSPSALQIRSAPVTREAIVETVQPLLTESGSETTGFICRTEFQADIVVDMAENLDVRRRIQVAVCNPTPKYTAIRTEPDAIECGEMIGRMLLAQKRGRPPNPRGMHLPVRLNAVGGESAYCCP